MPRWIDGGRNGRQCEGRGGGGEGSGRSGPQGDVAEHSRGPVLRGRPRSTRPSPKPARTSAIASTARPSPTGPAWRCTALGSSRQTLSPWLLPPGRDSWLTHAFERQIFLPNQQATAAGHETPSHKRRTGSKSSP